MAGKIYDPTKQYSDHTGAFVKLNKNLVEDLFAAQGPYSQAEFLPNWLVEHELGYELVRIDDRGDVVHNFGIFITIGARDLQDVEPVTQRSGRAVAYWNYKIHSLAEDYTIRMSSNVKYHYIVAYDKGYIGVNPIKSGPGAGRSVTVMENKEGEFPFLPFVALAFFMHIEKEEGDGKRLFDWLVSNAEGWADAYGTDVG